MTSTTTKILNRDDIPLIPSDYDFDLGNLGRSFKNHVGRFPIKVIDSFTLGNVIKNYGWSDHFDLRGFDGQKKDPYCSSKSRKIQFLIHAEKCKLDREAKKWQEAPADQEPPPGLLDDCKGEKEEKEFLEKLYALYGDQGNPDIYLGKKRTIVNGFEKNNLKKLGTRCEPKKIYRSRVFSEIWRDKNAIFPRYKTIKYPGDHYTHEEIDRPRSLGCIKEHDDIFYVSHYNHILEQSEVCRSKDDHYFLIVHKYLIIAHYIMSGDIMGYVFEYPSQLSESIFKPYTDSDIKKILK